jgi:hypothetical protein
LPFSFLLLIEPISNQAMADIIHLDFVCAAFQFCLCAFRNRNSKLLENFQFLFVVGFHYAELLSLDVRKAHNNTHEFALVGIGYRFRLPEHPNSVLCLVSPSHRGQELTHFACGYALELSLDGQRIDRALDTTNALSILKTNKENELNITLLGIEFFGSYEVLGILHVSVNNELATISIEPLAQIISLGEDDCLMIGRLFVCLFVCLEQSQKSIRMEMTFAVICAHIRTIFTMTNTAAAQLQSFDNICLIHFHFPPMNEILDFA